VGRLPLDPQKCWANLLLATQTGFSQPPKVGLDTSCYGPILERVKSEGTGVRSLRQLPLCFGGFSRARIHTQSYLLMIYIIPYQPGPF